MYERGDKVWWWSDYGGRRKATKAVFLAYDRDFPEEDCILVIPIGTFKQRFRWPLRLVESAH